MVLTLDQRSGSGSPFRLTFFGVWRSISSIAWSILLRRQSLPSNLLKLKLVDNSVLWPGRSLPSSVSGYFSVDLCRHQIPFLQIYRKILCDGWWFQSGHI